jgi:hypothetical protein
MACDGNFILIKGESYIRRTRTQENGDGLVNWPDNGLHRRTNATIKADLSCDAAQCESTVLIIGRKILDV